MSLSLFKLSCIVLKSSKNSQQKESIMNNKMTLPGVTFLLLLSPISQAAENAEVKNQVQQQTQTQTRNMSGEKNAEQGVHRQNMESMTEQERNLYQQLNSNKKEEGKKNSYGKGSGDGSGKKKRQRKGEGGGEGSEGDYYSPRGSGGGGGKGRGY
jgi:hypothetical protein